MVFFIPQMSGRTLVCTEAYRDAIDDVGTAVDENIKVGIL